MPILLYAFQTLALPFPFFVLPFDKIYVKMKKPVKSISYLVNRKARAMHGNSFMHFYGTGLV